MPTRALLLSALILLCLPRVIGAQEAEPAAWDAPSTLELVRRGMERRALESADDSLHSYAADAGGYVYFLLDAPELERQTLVRTDQVALQVYWRAPNQVRQRIVGLRERKELPITRLHYYLDRLTVVQDNYAQGIVIADGDNVNDVPHPISSGAEQSYEYRLIDSVTLRLPGALDPVRVHEIEVRPRDTSLPAVIGSVFLEEQTGALVRMNFTFTPSSYIDPRLDFINVTLENGLWEGRYWLPYEQRLEIRREIPELDLPFGTIIRTRMRIGDYRFNQGSPDWLFSYSAPISMAPREERERYQFEQPIDAEWRAEGIGQPLAVGELRAQAHDLLRGELLSGLPGGRLGALSASEILRYNRAEGPVLGGGFGLRPAPGTSVRANASWAFGPGHPSIEVRTRWGEERRWQLNGTLNRPRDVGGSEPAAGLTNSLSTFLLGRDWYDPYYVSGGGLQLEWPLDQRWSVHAAGQIEGQRSAEIAATHSIFGSETEVRPVRPIDQGTALSGSLAARRVTTTQSGGGHGEIRGRAGHLIAESGRDFTFGKFELSAGQRWTTTSPRRAELQLDLDAATTFGTAPRQELFLLGGRSTLPGFEHRAFGGDRYALARATATADLAHPWIRARLLSSVGWSGISSAGRGTLEAWGAEPSGSLRSSVGAGIGLFYDLLHLDLHRGLGPEGQTELIIEVQKNFWGFL